MERANYHIEGIKDMKIIENQDKRNEDKSGPKKKQQYKKRMIKFLNLTN